MTQVCPRCEGFIRTGDPRKIVDEKVYHLFCGYKVELVKSTEKGGGQTSSNPHKTS